LRLVAAGCGDADGRLGAWRHDLGPLGRLAGPWRAPRLGAPALGLPGLAAHLLAAHGHAPPPWGIVWLAGRAGLRQVAYRDGWPVLARLGPSAPDPDTVLGEGETLLAYLRRRGYRGGDPCALVVLGWPADEAPALAERLAPLAHGGPVLVPETARVADSVPGACLDDQTPPSVAAETLAALWALTPPARESVDLRPVDPAAVRLPLIGAHLTPATSGQGLAATLGVLAFLGLAGTGMELTALPTQATRIAALEDEIEALRTSAHGLEEALAQLPAPPEVLRALPPPPSAALPHPPEIAARLRAALGPETAVSRLELTRTGAGLDVHVTLAPEPRTTPDTLAALGQRLALAFPGQPLVLETPPPPSGPRQGTLAGPLPSALAPDKPAVVLHLTLGAPP
ncbi:hypothetical protein, partial [Pararhodospirillum oryzae]|uniref:hypothetical protein n=1 Tax=Pararhodospirillum oryzae TaxID=478448 RepID=UPI0014796193